MAQLLHLAAETNSSVLQYTLLALAALVAALRLLIRPLLPHICMDDLERVIRDTKDIFDKAQEEHLLHHRATRLDIQLRLSRAQKEESHLRSRVLHEHGLNCSTREYLFIFSNLACQLRRCRREVKTIQLFILKQVEDAKRGLHCERVEELAAVLSSERFRSG
ncbi:hypothetical protein MIND_00532000 [Mycena indigotica]|uniref:Uncharacterized protein n=1 Tax=Mycena indigotica TaxID=2126181 RepID=A0A8H6W694_9AGAR|nr:uncharacterized protein MIND_00532000 [Mycena indigotica]KAF7307379.1 hypothetical protein MIND_00532000 [Mycena indigotica]